MTAFPLPEFDHYDAELASRITDASLTSTGLPAYLGITTSAAGRGTLTAGFPVRDELLNPFGTMHGGALAALCDHVLGAVLYPVIERGAWAATTEFKLNLLAPVRQGEVEATATIVSKTARTAVVRIEIVNEGRAAGLAQGTVLIQPPKK